MLDPAEMYAEGYLKHLADVVERDVTMSSLSRRNAANALRQNIELANEVERLRAALENLSKPVPYPEERWQGECMDCQESQRYARETLEGSDRAREALEPPVEGVPGVEGSDGG